MSALRTDWGDVLEVAAPIVESYDTGVTLRQLFYRLVAAQVLPNTIGSYKGLSHHTARARRAGAFPDLIDRGRTIHRYRSFDGPSSAQEWLTAIYCRDRTTGQDTSVYLGVEKAGIVEQLETWFAELGIPIIALGGYDSQTHVKQVQVDVERQGRPAVLIYAGDFDPSGEDIDRDFVVSTDCWTKVVRIALTAEQVDGYQLRPQPGKTTDSRAPGFVARHGRLVQVELDALAPEVLRGLCAEAIADYWDEDAYRDVLEAEELERARLRRVADGTAA